MTEVKRFNYVGDDAEMVAESDGKFVRYSDYEQLESRLAQLTRERDDYRDQLVEAKAETVEKLAQVEKERSDSQERLAAEVANRVNVNVAKMEESQKTTQAELKRLVDDRPTDTCRGSYEG